MRKKDAQTDKYSNREATFLKLSVPTQQSQKVSKHWTDYHLSPNKYLPDKLDEMSWDWFIRATGALIVEFVQSSTLGCRDGASLLAVEDSALLNLAFADKNIEKGGGIVDIFLSGNSLPSTFLVSWSLKQVTLDSIFEVLACDKTRWRKILWSLIPPLQDLNNQWLDWKI